MNFDRHSGIAREAIELPILFRTYDTIDNQQLVYAKQNPTICACVVANLALLFGIKKPDVETSGFLY